MGTARCALGAAELGGRLVVCGGYDRARVLRSAERYCARDNAWAPLAELRGPRARFPAARLGDALYLLGGSDGHAELDSVEVLVETGAGARWEARARLPLARSHAGAAGVPARGELYAVGGWAAGLPLRRVHRYSPLHDKWTEAPPLTTGRSQCAVVWYSGALWALGGCDAWHCLASTELLRLDCEPEPEPAVEVEAGAEGEVEASPGWQAGPALPTARRSVGAAAWRGDLVVAGGSDGGASLRRTDWLNGDTWRTGPSLRRARAGLGLAVVGEALFAVGGFDGKEFLACVECLYQPAGEWTALCADRAPLPALPSAPSTPSTPSADPAPADATAAPADDTEQKKPEPEPAPGGQ